MKAIRTLALTVLTLLPAVGMAQTIRPFDDSWFWGIKTGGTLMQAPSRANLASPMIGAEWLITRTHGGLYVSLDQSFFTQQAAINDSVAPSDTIPGIVRLKDMRRLTLALMGFPGDSRTFHPYGGLGFTYNQVAEAKALGGFNSADQQLLANQIITFFKSVWAPVLMIGAQVDTRRGSAFVQAMGWPSNQSFFLYNNRGFNASIEFGLRFNLGTSIDQER
jgi:hypothetical protein